MWCLSVIELIHCLCMQILQNNSFISHTKACELLYWSVYTQLLVLWLFRIPFCLIVRKKQELFLVFLINNALSAMDFFPQIFLQKSCMIVSLLCCAVGYFVSVGCFRFFVCLFVFITIPAKSIGDTSLITWDSGDPFGLAWILVMTIVKDIQHCITRSVIFHEIIPLHTRCSMTISSGLKGVNKSKPFKYSKHI